MLTHLSTALSNAVVPLCLALLGFFLFCSGIWRLRRRPVRACLRASWGLLLIATAGLIWLLALNLHTYQRLTQEQLVAQLYFKQLRPQVYEVQLETVADGVSHYILNGDEWQLDARILKWQGWALLAGLETRYRLERLSGRYRDIRQELESERSLVNLRALSQGGMPVWFSEAEWADLWLWAQDYPAYLPLVDAVYGSATYVPMIDGATYQVSVTTSGLITRPLPAMR